jgi:hypothetical protein
MEATTRLDAMKQAAVFPIDRESVSSCLNARERPVDDVFEQAWRHGLASLPRERRTGALAGATGHVAESLVEILLEPYGFLPIHHFAGPGRHGVDLLLLTPDASSIVGVEVKGTLRPGYWPRLSRTEIRQMSAEWMDKADNPGMQEWDLESGDVFGAVVQVNLAGMVWRIGFTADFNGIIPVTHETQLADTVAWLKPWLWTEPG